MTSWLGWTNSEHECVENSEIYEPLLINPLTSYSCGNVALAVATSPLLICVLSAPKVRLGQDFQPEQVGPSWAAASWTGRFYTSVFWGAAVALSRSFAGSPDHRLR